MNKYAESGVDTSLGDLCSEIAYSVAKKTFKNRENKIGSAFSLDGGFSGAIDFGDFYITQNDDGIGTKTLIAEIIGKYDTLGHDLVAMVVDDGICLGAEMISISNTLDLTKEDPVLVKYLMSGLEKAAHLAGIIVPGGEIAILADELKSFTWNATALGIVKKNRLILNQDIKKNDQIIGIYSNGLRSNGFSLIRKIITDNYGLAGYHNQFDEKRTWGEVLLTPSLIYCKKILPLIGAFAGKPQVKIKSIIHVTGGGIPNNIKRPLKKLQLGANLNNLPTPHAEMLKIQELGQVDDYEAYQTWNMGIGMMLITNETEQTLQILKEQGLKAQIIGEITANPQIQLKSQGFFSTQDTLTY